MQSYLFLVTTTTTAMLFAVLNVQEVTTAYQARPGCKEWYPDVAWSNHHKHRHRNQENNCDLNYWVGTEKVGVECMHNLMPQYADCGDVCRYCYSYTAQYYYCFCGGTEQDVYNKCILAMCPKPKGRPGCKQWYPEYFSAHHHKRSRNAVQENNCDLTSLLTDSTSCLPATLKVNGNECIEACRFCFSFVAQHYYCFCAGSEQDVVNQCAANLCPAGSKMSKGKGIGFKKHKHQH